ncbi:MAG: BrnT family toxin [Thermomicrobiales bacterium]|nr:BrnT family toxin [Thermomicrobiales bacterium]
MTFEWDSQKNLENLRKHRITLVEATEVFSDEYRIEELDDRDYGEERWTTVGRLGADLVFVVYTSRHGVVRLISARKARIDEQKRYFSGWG